jgi:RNA polymerase sigma factor for flagellar operon FliA
LLQAIDAFDPLRGSPFEAFARPRIAGSISDGFSRSSELDAQRSQHRRLQRERLRSLKQRGETEEQGDAIETLSRIAGGLAIGLMLEGTKLIASDDEPDPAPSAYDTIAWQQLQRKLVKEIGRLSSNEAAVVRQHYEHGLAFAQVADLLGLSRGRISQLHRAAIIKLRKRLSREY